MLEHFKSWHALIIIYIFIAFRLIGTKSAGKSLPSGPITLNNFKTGPQAWERSASEITIPNSGWYEVRFSALHWRHSTSANEYSEVKLKVNGAVVGESYGYLRNLTETTSWGQNFNRDWFIQLQQNDKVIFHNQYPNSIWSDVQDMLFVKFQKIA